MAKRFATGVLVTIVLVMAMARVRAVPGQQKPIDYSTYLVAGVTGNTTCLTFNAQMHDYPKVWPDHYQNYAEGFITGANYHALIVKTGLPKVGSGESPEAMLAVMKQQCSAYPSDSVSDAIGNLYVLLLAKEPGQQKPADYSTYLVKGNTGKTGCITFNAQMHDYPKVWQDHYLNYAQGFITGANCHALIVKTGLPKVGSGDSPEEMLTIMKKRCNASPFEDVSDAIDEMYWLLLAEQATR